MRYNLYNYEIKYIIMRLSIWWYKIKKIKKKKIEKEKERKKEIKERKEEMDILYW